MHPLYVISGISGCGKAALGHKVVNRMSNEYIHLVSKPNINLSPEYIECPGLNERFCHDIRDKLNKSPVLLSGFAFPREILPVQPLVHIHLVTALDYNNLIKRYCDSHKSINEQRTTLMLQKVLLPFYHEMIRESDITHILSVFDESGHKISIELLTDTIIKIIMESKLPRQKHHNMHIVEPYYTLIKSGIKSVEGRKISEKWKNIRKDDIVTITSDDDNKPPFDVKVTGVTLYLPSLKDPLTEYLNVETLTRTLPGISSIDEGRNIYLQWSTEKEIKEMGMMGVQIQVL